MKMLECTRESETTEAVQSGRWPDGCHGELRQHVHNCLVCSEVVTVALALRTDYEDIAPDIRIPSAGLVWWRAELRARREAVRAVQRPLTLFQAFAAACSIGVVLALLSQ